MILRRRRRLRKPSQRDSGRLGHPSQKADLDIGLVLDLWFGCSSQLQLVLKVERRQMTWRMCCIALDVVSNQPTCCLSSGGRRYIPSSLAFSDM